MGEEEKVSRRKYLGAVGGLAAAAAVGWGLAGYFASKPPAPGAVKTVTVTKTVTAATTPTAAPIKIGVVGPFTGPNARVGEDIKRGTILRAEEAGYEILNRRVEFIWTDSESDPEKAVRAVEKAIREGAELFINGWHSSVALAIMDVTAKYKIVQLGHGGESEAISEKIRSNPEKYKYYFKGWPSPTLYTVVYAELIDYVTKQGIWTPRNKKFSSVCEDSEGGRSGTAALKSHFEKIGWERVSFDAVPWEQTDFYPIFTKIKDLDSTLVTMWHSSEAASTSFDKQMRELKVPALLIHHGLSWFPEWYKLTGEASNYVLDIQTPTLSKEFTDKYTKRWNIKPGLAACIAYDWTGFAFEAIERAGTLDRDALAKAILDLDYTGGTMFKHYKIDPTTHDPVVGKGYWYQPVAQYMNGKVNLVWPPEMATAEFEVPPWV